MPKQVRFTQLIKAAGKPHAATLWVADPKADPTFKKAIADNRVVTVHNVNVGAKKDSGHIGFAKGDGFTYLIFPKALPLAAGTKVIGLKFEMLDTSAVKDPVRIKPARRKGHRAEPSQKGEVVFEKTANHRSPKSVEKKKSKPARATPKFKVTLKFSAEATREVKVEAKNAADAIRQAVKIGRSEPPNGVEWKVDGEEVQKV